jgi:hypothetical protein
MSHERAGERLERPGSTVPLTKLVCIPTRNVPPSLIACVLPADASSSAATATEADVATTRFT